MVGERLRIDKFLWFARLARTRTTAQKLVVSGHVRINRQKIDNAARAVGIGDVLTVTLESGVRVLRIAAIGTRRGPAPEARLLYEDLTPVDPAGAAPPRRSGGSRPTKRDRRILDRLRSGSAADTDDFPSDGD